MPRISLTTNHGATNYSFAWENPCSGDRSRELFHPNMKSLRYICTASLHKNYTLWQSNMASWKMDLQKGFSIAMLPECNSSTPEENALRFWKAFFFPFLFSLEFDALNITLKGEARKPAWKSPSTQEEPIIREELGVGTGEMARMSQTHWAWLKVFRNHQKICPNLLWNAILSRVPKMSLMCVFFFPRNLPLKSSSFCKGPELSRLRHWLGDMT